MRNQIIGLALLAAACSPAAEQPGSASTEVSGAVNAQTQEAMLAGLEPVLDAEIDRPVRLNVTSVRRSGDWAFIVGQPRTPEGGAVDWSTTRLAARAAEGALDGDGTTYALMHLENEVWIVREVAIGPTDAAYAEWPGRHGAPANLVAP